MTLITLSTQSSVSSNYNPTHGADIWIGCPTGYIAIGGIANIGDDYELLEQGPAPRTAPRPGYWFMQFINGSSSVPNSGHHAICLQLPI